MPTTKTLPPIPISDTGYSPWTQDVDLTSSPFGQAPTQSDITPTTDSLMIGSVDQFQWTYTNPISTAPTVDGTVIFDAGIKTLNIKINGKTYSVPMDEIEKTLKKMVKK